MAEIERPRPAARRKTRNQSPAPASNFTGLDENAIPGVDGLRELINENERNTHELQMENETNINAAASIETAIQVSDNCSSRGSVLLDNSISTSVTAEGTGLEIVSIQYIEDGEASVSASETNISTEITAKHIIHLQSPEVNAALPQENAAVEESSIAESVQQTVTYPNLSLLKIVNAVEAAMEQKEISEEIIYTPSVKQTNVNVVEQAAATTNAAQNLQSVYAEANSRLVEAERTSMHLTTTHVQRPLSTVERQHVYRNVQLDLVNPLVDRFLEFCTRSRESHPFLILLRAYLQYLNELDEIRLSMDVVRKDYDSSRNSLWKTVNKSVTGTGRCGDGKQVSAAHRFRQSLIDEKSYTQLTHASEKIRMLIVHDGCVAKYTCQLCRTQIETFMARLKLNASSLGGVMQSMPVAVVPPEADRRLDKEELLNCVAILFAIQRFPVAGGNKLFLCTCRYWLSCLVAVLLRSASSVDHLYILNEVLRCPSDAGKWAGRLVQTCVPPRSQFACAHPATGLFIAQLSCLYMPVVAREEMLAKLKLKDTTADKNFHGIAGAVAGTSPSSFGVVSGAARDSYISDDWQMVDPDSNESVPLELHKILPLSETDMLTLMSQFRFDDLFDAVYDVERFDRRYASEHDLLRLIVFTHQVLRVIETGLANPRHVGNYHHFTRRNGQLVRQTVLCLHACVMRFSFGVDNVADFSGSSPAPLATGLQLEYEQVVLLAAQTLLRYPADGSVQFLVGLPYETLTFPAQCRLWKIMKTCGTAPDGLNNVVAASETKVVIPKSDSPQSAAMVQLEQLVDMKLGGSNALFLLVGFSDLASGISLRNAIAVDSNDVIRNQQKQALITDIVYHIFYLSCLSVTVRDKLAKSGRDLLCTLAKRHLFLISYLLELVPEYIERIGAVAVNIVQELPFKLWSPNADDIVKLCTWLVDGLRIALENMHASQKLKKKAGPLGGGTKNVDKLRELESKQKEAFRSCIHHLMARKILAQLDYDYRDASSTTGSGDDDLAIPQIRHRRITLALLQAHLLNQAQLASSKSQSSMFSSMLSSAATSLLPTAVSGGGTLKRGATIAASMISSSSSSSSSWDLHHVDYSEDYAGWCWQMLTFKLKSHPLVRSRSSFRRLQTNVVAQYDGAIADDIFDQQQFNKALNAEHRDKLACAAALTMAPSYSHSSAAVLERSLDLLLLLVIDDDKVTFVLLMLHQLLPLFFHNRQFMFLIANMKFNQLIRCALESAVLSSTASAADWRKQQQRETQPNSVVDNIWQGIGAAASGVANTLASTTGIGGAVTDAAESNDVVVMPSTFPAVDQRSALLAHHLLACYGSTNFQLCIVAWLRIVSVQPRWWLNENALAMVNTLSYVVLSCNEHEMVIQELRAIYSEGIQSSTGSGSSGVMSSLVSWASGSSNSTIVDWVASETTLKRFPLFSLFALQAEMKRTTAGSMLTQIEDEVGRQLNSAKASTTAEAALKKALAAVKISSSSEAAGSPAAHCSSLEQLPLVRWARVLLGVDVAEPSFVLFTQCFFERFLAVPSFSKGGSRRSGGQEQTGGGTLPAAAQMKSVGDRVFLTKSMLLLGKMLKTKLNSAQDFHYAQMTRLQSSQQQHGAAQLFWPVELHRRLYQLFRAMTFWLDEPRVHDGGTATSMGLPADYMPTMIERCRAGPFHIWRDYLPLNVIESCSKSYAESWQGPNFFRPTVARSAENSPSRQRSPARFAPLSASASSSSAPVSAVLGLPRALPPPRIPAFLAPVNEVDKQTHPQQLSSIVVRDEDAAHLFSDPNEALEKFRTTLTAVEQIAREQFERRSLLTSLDFDYLELVKELWHNVESSTTLSKSCGLRCSAPALLNVHFKESKRNEVAWSRAQQNRQQWQQQFLDEFNESSADESTKPTSAAGLVPANSSGNTEISKDEEPITDNDARAVAALMNDSARNFVFAVVHLEALIAELIRRYGDARRISATAANSNNSDSEVVENLQAIGIQLFYLILSFVKEHTVQYEPAGSFLRSCLALLGQHFISNVVEQQVNLLNALLRVCDEVSGASREFKQYYAALLVDCFSPMACVGDSVVIHSASNAVAENETRARNRVINAAAFIQLYRMLSEAWQARKVPAAIVLQFLSRFSRAYTLNTGSAAVGGTLPRSANTSTTQPSVSPIVSFFCSQDLTEKRRELMQLIVQTFTFGVRSARLDMPAVDNPARSASGAETQQVDSAKTVRQHGNASDEDSDGKVRHLSLQHFLSFVKVDSLQALYLALEKSYHAHQLLPSQLDDICVAMMLFDGAEISSPRNLDSLALNTNWFSNNSAPNASAKVSLIVDSSQLAKFLTDYFVQKRRHYWHGVGKRHRRSGGSSSTDSYVVGYVHHLQAYMPVLFAGPNCLFKILATSLAEIERAPRPTQQHQQPAPPAQHHHYGLNLLLRLFGALVLPLLDGELLASAADEYDDDDGEGGRFHSPVTLRSSKSTVTAQSRRSRSIVHGTAEGGSSDSNHYSPTSPRTSVNYSEDSYALQLRHSQSLCNSNLPPSRPPPALSNNNADYHAINVYEQIDFPWSEPKRDEINLLLKRLVELINAACVVVNNFHGTGTDNVLKGECAQLVWLQFACPVAQLWSTSSTPSHSSSAAQQHHMLAAEKFYLVPFLTALTRLETWSFWKPSAESWLILTALATSGAGGAWNGSSCVRRHHAQLLLDALNTAVPCEALARFALQIFVRLPMPDHIREVVSEQSASSQAVPEISFSESRRTISSAYFLLAMHSAIRVEMLAASERTSFLTHSMPLCAMVKLLGSSSNSRKLLPFIRNFWAVSVDRLAYEHTCGMTMAELQKIVGAARHQHATAANLTAETAFFAELDRWPTIDTLMRLAGCFYADVNFEQVKPVMLFVIANEKKLHIRGNTPPAPVVDAHAEAVAESRALRDFQTELLEKRTLYVQCRAVILQRRLETMLINAHRPGNDTPANVEATTVYFRTTLSELLYSVELVSVSTYYVKQPQDIVDVNVEALRHEQMIGLSCELLHALVNYSYSSVSSAGTGLKCIDVVLAVIHYFWRLPTDSSNAHRPLLLPFVTAVCRSVASLDHMTQLLEWCIETFWSRVQFASIVVDPVRGFLASSLKMPINAAPQVVLDQRQSSTSSFDLVENGSSLAATTNGNYHINPAEIYDKIRPLIENALVTPDLARHDFILAARKQRALLLIHAYAEYRLLHAWRGYNIGEKVHLMQEVAMGLNFASSVKNPEERPQPSTADEMKVMLLIVSLVKICSLIADEMTTTVERDTLHWRDAVLTCLSGVVDQLHLLCGEHQNNNALFGLIGSAFKQQRTNYTRRFKMLARAASWILASVIPATHISAKLSGQVSDAFQSTRTKKEYVQTLPELAVIAERVQLGVAEVKKASLMAGRLKCARKAIVESLELTFVFARMTTSMMTSTNSGGNWASGSLPALSSSLTGGAVVRRTDTADALLANDANNHILFEILMFKATAAADKGN